MKNEQKELRDHQIVTRAMRRLHAEDEITINRFVIAKDAFAGTLERLFEELGQTEAQKAVKNSMERARQGKPPSTELDNAVLTLWLHKTGHFSSWDCRIKHLRCL